MVLDIVATNPQLHASLLKPAPTGPHNQGRNKEDQNMEPIEEITAADALAEVQANAQEIQNEVEE